MYDNKHYKVNNETYICQLPCSHWLTFAISFSWLFRNKLSLEVDHTSRPTINTVMKIWPIVLKWIRRSKEISCSLKRCSSSRALLRLWEICKDNNFSVQHPACNSIFFVDIYDESGRFSTHVHNSTFTAVEGIITLTILLPNLDKNYQKLKMKNDS